MGPWGRAMAWLSVPAAPWSSVVLGRLQHLGMTSFLGIAFFVHGTPLFSLGLQSFLCSSRGSSYCISCYQSLSS